MTTTVPNRRPANRRVKHYVNNPDMQAALVAYAEKRELAAAEGREKPKAPNYIGESILMICQRLQTKHNFASYTWGQEMISDAIENCVIAIDNYKHEKYNNPFGYFSRIAWNAFLRRISDEKKEIYAKHKNMQNLFTESELFGSGGISSSDENSNRVIQEFEDKLAAKKAKKQAKQVKVVADE